MASVTVFGLIILQIANSFNTVQTAQQQLKLSDSYLPVAMQVIAHLTDQMAYEVRDEPVKPPQKPTATSTMKPVTWPAKPAATSTMKPVTWPAKPSKPGFTWSSWSTQKPMYVQYVSLGAWDVGYVWRVDQTTPYHRPGLFAPIAPPPPGERKKDTFLLPPNQHQPYTVIGPSEIKTKDTFLKPHNHEFTPLVDPKPEEILLPPNFDSSKLKRISDDGKEFFIDDEMVTDEKLQYLSPDLKDMLKLAHDYEDERLIEEYEDLRMGDDKKVYPKGKPSASNLRLQLLYDLLSRDAKKQRLNEFSGFSNSVMQELAESSSGGARNQLSFALSRMLARHDCSHDYANNRAREMIQELGKDESTMSNEIRYLQPLVYRV